MSTAATEVIAYYFPQFHVDPRNEAWFGPGWTEWALVRAARPRFQGHRQPRVPSWGEFDESDPVWSTKEIDLAADHGITAFAFDWYWYEGKPFLNGALERGFLRAPNSERLKFALMWANHDWLNLFPAAPGGTPPTLLRAQTSPAEFEHLVDYALEHYLSAPNYLRIDGAPYFSIYDLAAFVRGVGGLEAASQAIARFRRLLRARGIADDLHLNAVVWGVNVLPSETRFEDPSVATAALGVSSLTTYAWVHHYPADTLGFPRGSYADATEHTVAAWERYATALTLPYHPNVSVGWDPSPRTQQDVPFENHGYPWHAVLEGNTPAAFEAALIHARDFLDGPLGKQRVVTINAWNEWTEGSYLLPDTDHANAYLEAVRRVFARERR
jgi:hypothetical protein